MSRFYFQVFDGHSPSDKTGLELPDLASAREAALQLSGRALAGGRTRFWDLYEWRLDVTDSIGLILFSLLLLAVDSPATSEAARVTIPAP